MRASTSRALLQPLRHHPAPPVPSTSQLRAAFDTLEPKSRQAAAGLLRNVFKDNANTRSRTGRFGHDELRQPSDFSALTRRTIRRAELIVNRILAYTPTLSIGGTASTSKLGKESSSTIRHLKERSEAPPEERDLLLQVKQIDRLSDLLCSVIDLAELVRNVDPNPEWVNAADQAYQNLCYYMNQLNTHVGLYEALKAVYSPLAHSPSTSPLFPALTVASQFLADFEKSGIHLPKAQRDRFVDLSDEILALGRSFTNSTDSAEEYDESASSIEEAIPITLAELAEMNEGFVHRAGSVAVHFDEKKHILYLPWNSGAAQSIRKEHPSASVRERFYVAGYSATSSWTRGRLEILENLLSKRSELAKLVGKRSWAEVTLSDKMAKRPENVISFLDSLKDRNKPLARKELEQLQRAKAIHLNLAQNAGARLPSINVWDREYYSTQAISLFSPSTANIPQQLSPYFSVGTCISSLSSLFTSLFGVSFSVVPLEPGEGWLPEHSGDLVKLEVSEEGTGKIGTIYCDLYSRANKPQGAAHYTIRCSRRTDDDDAQGDWNYRAKGDAGSHEPLPLSGIPGRFIQETGETHQLPVVVLSCDFDRPTKAKPGLLSWHEVETVFHEIGHAMHSMLGRTAYHNVSGTRCATDLVELPSILMEHFLSSPSVLSFFTHWQDPSRTLPQDLLQNYRSSLKGFSALESNSQIMLARVDQEYHSAQMQENGWETTDIWLKMQKEVGVIPPAEGTAWQANFTHLVGYGATYYSYLLDRALASRVYSQHFKANALSREKGEKYKQNLLKYGGGRDPWRCVGDLLDDEVVREGGQAALSRVGGWGVDT